MTQAVLPTGSETGTPTTTGCGECAALREEVERLRREIRDLRQQAAAWKELHARAVRKNERLKTSLLKTRTQMRLLRQQIFGHKSERGSRRDARTPQDDDGPDGDPKKTSRKRGGQRGHAGHGRRDYSHLPQREESIELVLGESFCPRCGKPYLLMSDSEDSEQVEIEVQAYRRVIHRRRYRRDCTCPGAKTFTAPRPAKLIPKGLYGTSVWVEVLLDKFSSYRPTARLLDAWRQYGLALSAATLTSGLRKLERMFRPAHEALLERDAQGDLHQSDGTGWPMFFPHSGRGAGRWCLWGFSGKETSVFRIDPSRRHQIPEGHYSDSPSGVLVVDRAKVYKAMKQVKAGRLRLAFCWSHVRRDFLRVARAWHELEPWSLEWLRQIRMLYRINRQRRKHPVGSAEYQQQHQALQATVTAMQERARIALADPKLRSPCRTVMESLLKHWPGLTRFVMDSRIPMDNNGQERHLRGPVLGRKNFYGSGAVWTARLAAEMFSVLGTLALWKINPRTWLTWYLESRAATGRRTVFDVQPFLPWNLSADRLAALQGRPPPCAKTS